MTHGRLVPFQRSPTTFRGLGHWCLHNCSKADRRVLRSTAVRGPQKLVHPRDRDKTQQVPKTQDTGREAATEPLCGEHWVTELYKENVYLKINVNPSNTGLNIKLTEG